MFFVSCWTLNTMVQFQFSLKHEMSKYDIMFCDAYGLLKWYYVKTSEKLTLP